MGPTALFPLRRKACWGFLRPKNPTASAGCEPANLGTKGQHATSRPPKPQMRTLKSSEMMQTSRPSSGRTWQRVLPRRWRIKSYVDETDGQRDKSDPVRSTIQSEQPTADTPLMVLQIDNW